MDKSMDTHSLPPFFTDFVSTVGRDEQVIRDYIRHQEAEDRRIEQLQLV